MTVKSVGPWMVLALLPLLGAGCVNQAGEHPQPALMLASDRLASIRLCSALDSVSSVFGAAVDTTMESEGESWPAKVVTLADGHLLFSSSWADREHVWLISASSKQVATASGVRVGASLDSLIHAGVRITAYASEGGVSIHLDSAKLGAEIDSLASTRLGASLDSLKLLSVSDLPLNGHIVELFTLGNGCGS